VAQVLGQFVAPATLLAGLLFYWGFFHARGFCAYFGVNSSLLGLTTTDYVMRSADGLFVPLAVYATVALTLLWGWTALPKRFTEGPWPPWLLRVTIAVAILLVVIGLSRLFVETWFNSPLMAAPSCIITGLLLLWAIVIARRRTLPAEPGTGPRRSSYVTRPVEWVLIIFLAAGSFFWGATDYSLAVGNSRAVEFQDGLTRKPGATVFSEKALGLNMAGVTSLVCTLPEAAYHFRYDGLVLVMTTGENFVLVPRSWSPETGTAVVLPRNGPGAIRLEFHSPVADAYSREASPC
jgi:hypothetical protein